jgi:WD40 repeat protein
MTGLDSAAAPFNPFVGPRPLEKGQPIFGRDLEIAQLFDMLCAERVVLLYSPSGAGKSSLIQAGLIPRLAEQFDVWKPVRVNLPLEPDADPAINRFVRSCNLGFEAGVPERLQRGKDIVSAMSLAQYAASRPLRPSAPKNIALIFDQFEEILTVDPLGTETKRAFFSEFGKLLQDNPRMWALFVIREDYLAPFDPYEELLPTHLKSRFRLDLLSRAAAGDAIRKTVESAGRTFAPGVPPQPGPLARLVSDLAMMQVQQPGGEFKSEPGPYIEPLHLQVVCRNLWQSLSPGLTIIENDDIESFGDVTRALAEYYETEIAKASGATEKAEEHIREWVGGDERIERSMREWVGKKLITSGGTRGQVLREAGKSGGLDNSLIALLIEAHLVRAEHRAGADWYELSHDRMIKPVQESNRLWLEKHLTHIQKTASLWEDQGKPDGLLLLGARLKEAKAWASRNRPLTTIEEEFLQASVSRNRSKQLQFAALCAVILFAVGAALGGFGAWRESIKAHKALAQSAVDDVPQSFKLAGGQGAPVALAQLAMAMRYDPDSLGARAWISSLLARNEWWLPRVSFYQNDLTVADLTRDGKMVLTGSKDGTVQLWDAASGRKLGPPLVGPSPVDYAMFSRDGSRLLVQSGKSAQIWDTRSFSKLGKTLENDDQIYDASFSWDGTLAATAAAKMVTVWNTNTGQIVGKPLIHPDFVSSVDFSHALKPDLVLTASDDGVARVWNSATGDLVGSTPPGPGQAGMNYARFNKLDDHIVTAFARTKEANEPEAKVEVWRYPLSHDLDAKPLGTLTHKDDVRTVAFSETNPTEVVTASYDNTAKIWDVSGCPNGDQVEASEDCFPAPTTLNHEGSVFWASYSEDGLRVITASFDQNFQVWSTIPDHKSGVLIGSSIPHVDEINGGAISRNGSRVLTSSKGGTAQIWALEAPVTGAGQPVTVPGFTLYDANMTKDGLYMLASIAENGQSELEVLNEEGSRILKLIPIGGATDFVFAQDGRHVLLYNLGKSGDMFRNASFSNAQVWDFSTGRPVGTGSPISGTGLPFLSPDGRRILAAAADANGDVQRIYDAASGKALGPFARKYISGHAFSPDGANVVTVFRDSAQVWDAASGKLIGNELKHRMWVNDAEFSQDGKRVVTASNDLTAVVWNASTGTMIGKPMSHGGKVIKAKFSPDPDGKFILTETQNHLAQVWDVATSKRVGAAIHFGDFDGDIVDLDFSPDGKMILTHTSKIAKVWDAMTGKPIGAQIGSAESIRWIAFTPDGREIVTFAETYSGVERRAVDSAEAKQDPANYTGLTNHFYTVALGSGSHQDNELLATLAEVVGGYRIDTKTGAPEVIEPRERVATIQKLRQQYKIPENEDFLQFFIKKLSEPPEETFVQSMKMKLTGLLSHKK